jgi:hypothetical protein
MGLFEKIAGTVLSFFQIGDSGGPGLNANAGALEARNAANSAFAVMRGATPAGSNDLVTLGSLPASFPSGTAGQLLITNAVPAAAWVSLSGDGTLSATGVLDIVQITGTAGNANIVANTSLTGLAGTGGLAFGAMTGDTTLPTGNLTYVAAVGKTIGITGDNASDTIVLGAGTATNSVKATGLSFGVTAAPALTQAAQTTDIVANATTITTQAPWAGAATFLSSAPLIVNSPQPVTSAGSYGGLIVQGGGSAAVTIGPEGVAAGVGVTNFGGVWFGTPTPTANNIAFAGDGSTLTAISAPTGGTVSIRINGVAATGVDVTAAAVKVTPPLLEWLSTIATPKLTQIGAASDVATTNLTIAAQAPFSGATGTNRNPGNLQLQVAAAAGAGTQQGFVQVQSANANYVQMGQLAVASSYGVIWLSNLTPSGTNYALASNGSITVLSAPTTLDLAIAGTVDVTLNASLLSIGKPVGGLGTFPYQWSGQTSPNTVACGTGGTQTISAAQSIIPFFQVTTGTLTSNAIVDFGTNAVTGWFVIGLSGVGTLGAFTLGFKNGTTTRTITATQLANLIATGATMAVVVTSGTNNIDIVS